MGEFLSPVYPQKIQGVLRCWDTVNGVNPSNGWEAFWGWQAHTTVVFFKGFSDHAQTLHT